MQQESLAEYVFHFRLYLQAKCQIMNCAQKDKNLT